jgi:hypothetical protein
MRTIAMPALVALTAALGIGAAVAVPASAAPLEHQIFGVSCVSAKDCVAVGLNQDAYGNKGGPLADAWNGKTWKSVPMKLPAAAISGELFGVSCKSATACMAVGLWLNSSFAGFPLAQTWNGKAWTASTPPSPSGSSGVQLNAVSCATAKNCVAAGIWFGKSGAGAILESWSGGKWAIARPALPKGSVSGSFSGVSCEATAFCVAVGSYTTSTGGGPLVYSWNGKAWKPMTVPPPAFAKFGAFLQAVSCTSAKSCVAVGRGRASDTFSLATGFAEVWNGKAWKPVTIGWPKGSYPLSVSCTSPNSCITAGVAGISLTGGESNTGRAISASWNGKAWAGKTVPAPGSGKASVFYGVSCVQGTCVAGGQEGPYKTIQGPALAGVWNGKTWKLTTAP